MSMNFPQRYKADIVSAVESIDLDKVIEIIELFKQARAAWSQYLRLWQHSKRFRGIEGSCVTW